jgi:hypothetical protein
MCRIGVILLMCLCAMLSSAVQGYAAPQYAVTDLGAFEPTAIAGSYVVGAENGLPVRLNIDTGEKVILGHEGHGGMANDVLPTGEAVGTLKVSRGGALTDAATFWDRQGRFVLRQGALPSYGVAVNTSLTMAGTSNCPGGQRASRWWADGRTEACGPLSLPGGIDAQHQVWGTSNARAVAWHVDGSLIDLGLPPRQFWFVSAVNAQGDSAGAWAGGGFTDEAWLRTADGTITELVNPLSDCAPRGINRARVIVGDCYRAGVRPRATLWVSPTEAYLLSDLAPLGDVDHWATGISDEGRIVLGGNRNVLLSPVAAEPPSLALHLNQLVYRTPGDTLRVDVTLRNPGPMRTTDVYFGVILPDGDTVLWLTSTAPIAAVAGSLRDSPATFTPLFRGASWPANLDVTHRDVLVRTYDGQEALGLYVFLVAWVQPDSLADGRLDEGDVLALDWKGLWLQGGPPLVAQR